MHCKACPYPFGKYQVSPASKSSVDVVPSGVITVVRTLPSRTNAHSAAMECQCSSRNPPGFNCIITPAMLCDIGNSSTDASLALPPAPDQLLLPLAISYIKSSNSAGALSF